MDIAGETTPGSRASRKRACVLWRGDGTTQPFRSWFSFACENRAPWSGADGWVEKCAWALTVGLLLRIVCAGQTISIKEHERFVPLCGIGKHREMINPPKRAAYLDPGRDREEVQDSYTRPAQGWETPV